MALDHAILAFLGECTYSGYDLTKKLSSVGFFWTATHQQVYRELAKLEAQGWVKSEVLAQENRPNKKLYSVTDLGRKELAEWIAQPSEPTSVREDLLVKIFAGYLVPKPVIIEELKRRRKIHLEKLSAYQDLERQDFGNIENLALEKRFRYQALRRGIRYEADWVEWCNEAIQVLTNMMSS
ncbi:PadR family transcriptional regulator [Aetokthonos hydrillicola Thurmond2011]|jgi:DNA-binding PadR family transcriptional regulator|uniref:PadR family transcriptional regulator n=1 Tax=Aetokthonos hydrillicola Thurmond2011 TaxID=2712845 RepID=A0AAP5ICS2_9CYAN|nr:PadR family transcriptional regulator [Aetokthonos hydrillicola]MBO3462735.1 PadR family transcriptional regulator [Aetokthonos hydrillicola CCALA 1050]MBW4585741.1 PadR family transcriptional regulator [Aetokthonos hydrillicola CCALA 1050]MDR9899245.1 PadR family transcriptional regulator [Aetokthonos hydrillicola Thurmond2011]